MQKQSHRYDFPSNKMPKRAFDVIGIISLGGGNSLIVNKLEYKPNNLPENLLKKYYSGNLKRLKVTSFYFPFQSLNKQSLTNLII